MNTANRVPSIAILGLMEPQLTLQPPALSYTRGREVQDGAFRLPSLVGQANHVMELSLSSGVSSSLKHFWQVKVTLAHLYYLSTLLQVSAELGLHSPLPSAERHRTDNSSLLCTLASPSSALRTVKLLPQTALILAAVEVRCWLINANEKQGAKPSMSS